MASRKLYAFIRGASVCVIALVVLAAGVGIYLYNTNDEFRRRVDQEVDSRNPAPSSQTVVTPEGGTFRYNGGVAITVPEGAVTKDTALSYGGVKTLGKDESGPLKGLRSSAVGFDVSLTQDGKTLQPKKPLAMHIPESSKLAGAGTPFAYTVLGSKAAAPYALLDTKRQKDGSVYVQLPHLSPKVITYLSDQALVDLFKETAAIQDRGTCKQEITVTGTKVRIGQKQGWSLSDDSAIFACLVAGKGTANVGIVNRIDYMLSVAATDNLRLATSGADLETELVKKLNNSIFPNDKVKALIANGEKLVAEAKPGSLPATVELQADPKTFYAESAYNVVGFFVGLLTGVGKGGEVVAIVAKALENAEIISCFQNAFSGDLSDAWEFGNAVGSCFFVVAEFVASHLHVDWFGLLKGLQAASLVADTLVKAYNGIRLTLNDTMRVTAEVEGYRYNFYGLLVPMKDSWVVVDGYKLADTSTCDEPASTDPKRLTCSVALFTGPDALRSWSDEKQLDYATCLSEDGSVIGPHRDDVPVFKGKRSVGGREADYFEMRRCPASVPQQLSRYWKFDDRRLLVTTLDDNGIIKGLDEALKNSTWR